MMPVIYRYGDQLSRPHFTLIDQPKESVVVSQELIKGILEDVFQIVGLNVETGQIIDKEEQDL